MISKFIISGAVTVFLAMISISAVYAEELPLYQGNEGNVPICHATASESNQYVFNSPNYHSIVNGEAHSIHQDPGDIIPAFRYKQGNNIETYSGRNWNTEGQEIWNNGCDTDNSNNITFCHIPEVDIENPQQPQTLTMTVNAAVSAGHFVLDENDNLIVSTGHSSDYLGECKINGGGFEPNSGNSGQTSNPTSAVPQGTKQPDVSMPAEVLPYTAGNHTLAYTLIAAGLATIVTGILIGGNILYRRIS